MENTIHNGPNMTAEQVAVSCGFYIARAEAAGTAIHDGNVIDLLADNLDADLSILRKGLGLSQYGARFAAAVNR